MSERVRLSEVAAHAGVSKATASKVLNGRPGVAEETRRLVRDAIAALGYEPSTGPRDAPAPRSMHVVFDTMLNIYAVDVLDGLIKGGAELGVEVVTASLGSEGPVHEPLTTARIERIAAKGGAGLVVVTAELADAEIEACERLKLPLVVIDPANPLDERVTSIGATNWAGGVQATRHLLGLGHNRIAFAGGPARSVPARERLHGYREALESAGIAVDPALVGSGRFGAETGASFTERLLNLDEPPTAVFAASDSIAIGVFRAARRRGLDVPADLSVIGFDDAHNAAWTEPPLTTVKQPLRQMGRAAARTVLDLASGLVPDSHHVQLATTLVIRESTAPPRR